jgi:malate dehydrogenase
VDSVGSIINPTSGGDFHSVCLCSDGSYGVDEGLISSFPVRNVASKFDIVQGVQLDAFSQGKLNSTVNELKEEREMVKELLPG